MGRGVKVLFLYHEWWGEDNRGGVVLRPQAVQDSLLPQAIGVDLCF